jgi:hypothetical protein
VRSRARPITAQAYRNLVYPIHLSGVRILKEQARSALADGMQISMLADYSSFPRPSTQEVERANSFARPGQV